MDPNLFHIDWEQTFEVLTAMVVIAFLLERALSLAFENRLILPHIEGNGMKELIAFAVAAFVCIRWQFDAPSVILHGSAMGYPGEFITAGVIAGGSKASVKLFREILGFKSTTYAEYEALRKSGVPPKTAARMATQQPSTKTTVASTTEVASSVGGATKTVTSVAATETKP